MRITFVTRKFGNVERNSHCDVLHIAPVRVANLVLDCNGDFAIKAYGHCSTPFLSIFYSYMVQTQAHRHSTTIPRKPGHPRGMYFNGQEGNTVWSLRLGRMMSGGSFTNTEVKASDIDHSRP